MLLLTKLLIVLCLISFSSAQLANLSMSKWDIEYYHDDQDIYLIYFDRNVTLNLAGNASPFNVLCFSGNITLTAYTAVFELSTNADLSISSSTQCAVGLLTITFQNKPATYSVTVTLTDLGVVQGAVVGNSQTSYSFVDIVDTYINIDESYLAIQVGLGLTGSFALLGILFGAKSLTLYLDNFAKIFKLIDICQQIYYVSMMNVDYPVWVRGFLNIFWFSRWKYFPNMFQAISYPATTTLPPDAFLLLGMDTYYFTNAAQSIFLLLLVLVLFILSKVLRSINKTSKFLLVNATAFEYSVVIMFIYSVYIELALSSFLQVYTTQFSPGVILAGAIFAIITLAFLIVFPIIQVVIITRNKKVLARNYFRRKYGFLYENCKTEKWSARYHYSVDLIRKIIHSLTIVYLGNEAIGQTMVGFLLFFVVLFHGVLVRPFKKAKDNYLLIFNELMMTSLYCCPFIISVIKFGNPEQYQSSRLLISKLNSFLYNSGWVMIGIVSAWLLVHLFMNALDLFRQIQNPAKAQKEAEARKGRGVTENQLQEDAKRHGDKGHEIDQILKQIDSSYAGGAHFDDYEYKPANPNLRTSVPDHDNFEPEFGDHTEANKPMNMVESSYNNNTSMEAGEFQGNGHVINETEQKQEVSNKLDNFFKNNKLDLSNVNKSSSKDRYKESDHIDGADELVNYNIEGSYGMKVAPLDSSDPTAVKKSRQAEDFERDKALGNVINPKIKQNLASEIGNGRGFLGVNEKKTEKTFYIRTSQDARRKVRRPNKQAELAANDPNSNLERIPGQTKVNIDPKILGYVERNLQLYNQIEKNKRNQEQLNHAFNEA